MAEERDEAARIVQSLKAADLLNFAFDGVELGSQVKAASLRFLVRGSLEADPEFEAVVRKYLEAAILTTIATRNLRRALNIDTVVINHGIYIPHGALADTARTEGCHVAAWSFSYRANCVVFSHEYSDIFTIIDEPTSAWENMGWNEAMERDLMDYLESRAMSGNKDWIMPFHKDSQRNIQALAERLGIDFSKPTIGLCTNVIWDGAVCYSANAFCGMVDWVLFTINYFAARPDLQLVIRIHPAEVRFTNVSRERALDAITTAFPELPKNVFVIPPESDANTYAVMEECRAVIIYGTSLGMELTSRGIPVIVAGQAWIRNKGIAYEANTEDEYLAILESLPFAEIRMSPEKLRRARMYAYHYCMRRCIPIEHSFPREGWPFLGVGVESLSELLPGRAPALDVICDGVLTRSDFIFPAERFIRSDAIAEAPHTVSAVG